MKLSEQLKTKLSSLLKSENKVKVLVGDIEILGNKYFTKEQISEKLALQAHSRISSLGSSSVFQQSYLARDTEFIAYLYRDSGFINVNVASPITHIDPDRSFVRIVHSIEEGKQYYLNSIKITGDVGPEFYPEKELTELMKLKPKDLFKYSYLHKDIEMLIDKYGDLGYAYVDINPLLSLIMRRTPLI